MEGIIVNSIMCYREVKENKIERILIFKAGMWYWFRIDLFINMVIREYILYF